MRLKLAALFVVSMLLAACGGGGQHSQTASLDNQRPELTVDSETAELANLTTPPGVDPELFAGLKRQLADVLAGYPAGKIASEPPQDNRSATTLSINASTLTLTWYYYSTGDYNQDGFVTVNDITPLGQNFGAAGPFAASSALSCVDGNQDGFITVNDITPIGQAFGRSVTGYNLYTSPDIGDYPDSAGDGNGQATLIDTVAFSAATGGGTTRKQFSYQAAQLNAGASVWVRPTDGTTEGTPSSRAEVPMAGNTPPVAAITAAPDFGDAPLNVSFDAGGSYDPDGSIVKYEWEWTGFAPGWEWTDTGTTPTFDHTFDTPGTYNMVVRVTDDLGATDNEFATVTVTNPGNDPPVASLSLDPTSGDEPLAVSLDASLSSDIDGTIEKYEWDWEGDGTYDLDSGTTATADHTYNSGTYQPTVRVTDDLGATDTGTKILVVGGTGPEWHVYPVILDQDVFDPMLTSAGSYPAIFYYDNTASEVRFLRADNGLGSSWSGTPKTVGGYMSVFMKTLETCGPPAIVYLGEGGLLYVRATDANGTSWITPVSAGQPEGPVYEYGAAFIDGSPAVSFGTSGTPTGHVYRRANDNTGAVWSSLMQINENNFTILDLANINNAPGLCYKDPSNGGCLSYCWADDAFGSTWHQTTVDTGIELAYSPTLQLVSGRPAILYSDFLPESVRPLYYLRAEDTSGSSWDSENRILLDSLQFILSDYRMAVINEKPAVAYTGGPNNTSGKKDLYYKRALDATGSDWPETAELVTDNAFGSTRLWIAEINGRPAIVYNTEESPEIDIYFAIYY
ncbi:PKD domain-containing protein [bacterium]|nr:PKD domain-containing protein [bacterium]